MELISSITGVSGKNGRWARLRSVLIGNLHTICLGYPLLVKRYAYLGPVGTFTEAALKKVATSADTLTPVSYTHLTLPTILRV